MELQDSLRRDLALAEPPLGDVVGTAVAHGRVLARRSRYARVFAGAGAVTLIATGAAAVAGATGGSAPQDVVGGFASSGADGRSAADTAPAGRQDPVLPTDVRQPLVVTGSVPTDAELVEQVREALRRAGLQGTVTVVHPDEAAMVQVDVVGPDGPGMFRVAVGPGTEPPPTAELRPDGSRLEVGGIPDNCIQQQFAVSTRSDGIEVYVGNASCLAWDGSRNAPAVPPLTTEQLRAFVQDPALGG